MTNERAERLEHMAYSLGYERGRAKGELDEAKRWKAKVEALQREFEDVKKWTLKSIPTKTIKYYDEDEQVWKIGEVIVDE